ncbi:multidrug transporter [Paenibacillus swuensis]|uniref:Multidrug transporter n=1 Tax=Paenibacillus swuensis TaxID=1178515 RepID=A0A172TPV5_9BACL|nr:MFS transporter [Paenibacillus swuensis]ANE49085.1 multidrug transporter [Paenibacillus swuensis]
MERWKINLAVLWIGQFLVMGGMTMIIPFLPLYLQELGLKDPDEITLWAGIIFAGNFVTSFLFQPLWGKLADKYGRKMMLLRSGFGMAAVMATMGLAMVPWHLLVLRLINGTISGFNPAAVSLMAASTPKEHRGFVMGILQSGSVAGTIFGPLLGGLVANEVGYRPIFYITGALIFAASLLAMALVKEDFQRKTEAQEAPLSVFGGWQELKRIPQLPALFTVTVLLQFSMLSSMPLVPLFVQELSHDPSNIALYAGLVGSMSGFSNLFASPLLGRISDRLGAEKVLVLSLIGAVLCFIPQAFVTTVWQLMAARFLLGVCMGGMLPSINALIGKYTPKGMDSRAYSFNTSALSLGNMIGPVGGGLLAGFMGIRGIFIVSAVLLVLNVLWVRSTLLKKSTPHHASSK